MADTSMFDLSTVVKDALKESAEFAPGSYATKDVSNHIADPKVSIPGGDKEQPGDSAKEYTNNDHESELKKFQKSFKEACEVACSLMEEITEGKKSSKKDEECDETKDCGKRGKQKMKELYKEYVNDFVEKGIEGSPLSYSQFVEEVENRNSDGMSFTEATSYLSELCVSIIGSEDSTMEEITEATRLAKEINNLSKRNDQVRQIISELRARQEKYPKNSPEYKMIGSKIDELHSKIRAAADALNIGRVDFAKDVDSIGNAGSGNGRYAKSEQKAKYNTTPTKDHIQNRKPGSISQLNKSLKSIRESVDECLREYEDTNAKIHLESFLANN